MSTTNQTLTYLTFYRRYGIRTLMNLMQPTLHELKYLDLPLNSVYHYANYDSGESGPASDDYLFRHIRKPILVEHVTELKDEFGTARRQAVNVQALIRDYHNFNRRTRQLKSWSGISRDPTTLAVVNYSLLNKGYRYVKSVFTDHQRWYNLFATYVQRLSTLVEESDRQHFLICGAPRLLPNVAQLNQASRELNATLLKIFRDKDTYLLLELWKWIGPTRSNCLLDKIPAAKIHLINFVFQESGRWTVLNLGQLNAMRRGQEDNVALLKASTTVAPEQLQKYVLRMAMSVMEARTVGAAVEEEPEEAEPEFDEGAQLSSDSSDDDGQTTISEKKVSDLSASAAEPEPTSDQHQVADEDEESGDGDEAARLAEMDRKLDEDLAQLNEIAKRQSEIATDDKPIDLRALVADSDGSLEDAITDICNRLSDDGLLSAAEYRRNIRQASAYKQLPSPDGKTTLDKYIEITSEELKIHASPSMPDSEAIFDKTMLKSSLIEFDSRYIEDILPRNIAGMVLNLQKAGVAVTGYNVERVRDVLGGFEMYTVKLAPVEGQPSTLRFKLPIVEKNGTFTSNGVKYRIRKQRGELPIFKTSPNRVALTSYYGKTFVKRGRKKVNDYGEWLSNQVMLKGVNKEDHDIVNVVPGNAFDHQLQSPRPYSALSARFNSFSCRGFELLFNQKLKAKYYPANVLSQYEKDGFVVMGRNAGGQYLVMDPYGAVYTTEGASLKLFGSVESFLNIPNVGAPVEFTEVVVFGKEIPVGVVLAYRMGFTNLLKALRVNPKRVTDGRIRLASNEYAITFSDETLIFSKDDRLPAMILAGFNEYHRALKSFSVHSFDRRGVYLNLLDSAGLSARYLREIDLMFQLFVDPITKHLLEEMNEPVTLQGLLIRSCEMLLSDQHPREGDGAFKRVKGYERMAGAVYNEMVQSVRAHNGRMAKSTARIEMNPYAVWKRVTEDPAKSQVNEINPIEELKQIEAVTMAGTGGRMKRSMTKSTRRYDPNDMGTISESTVDSSDVAINMFLSADPQFTSLYGLAKRYEPGKTGVTALLSTSALCSPASDRDDPKRVNFVAIQQSHSIACHGYHQSQFRTGYEQVIPHRTSDLFAYTAKKPGTVKSVNYKGVVIVYDDGAEEGYETGRRFGNAAGLTIPHEITTTLKEGDKVNVGDTIVYNTGFFEPDFFNKKRVIWKNSITARTVLWESKQTLEDASSISAKVAERLTTKTTKVKHIVVSFDQAVNKLVTAGQAVTSDSILCVIEDAITANNKLFTDATIDTLKIVGAQTPRAGVKGVIERVEVFYHGDKEDMSESLRALANQSDREMRKNAEALGRQVFSGSVDGGFRIEANPLALDTAAIRIYITSDIPAGIGDKGVFANQMKTVFSEVLEEPYKTEDGVEVDAIFGQKSIADRIVHSPETIGTTVSLLDFIADEMIAIYRS